METLNHSTSFTRLAINVLNTTLADLLTPQRVGHPIFGSAGTVAVVVARWVRGWRGERPARLAEAEVRSTQSRQIARSDVPVGAILSGALTY
jgi:hypothetical protein